MLDLRDGGLVLIGRTCAGNGEIDLAEGEVRSAVLDCRDRFHQWHVLAACAGPSKAAEFAERMGGRPCEAARYVMPGTIGLAVGAAPVGVVVEMLPRIPSIERHVDTAAIGNGIIDHQHLLMVGASQGVLTIQPNGDLPIPFPAQEIRKVGRPCPAGKRCRAPQQDPDFETRGATRKPEEEVSHPTRGSIIDLGVTKRDGRIKVPADKKDRPLGRHHRRADRGEIVIGIDEDRKLVGFLDAPAVLGRREDRGKRHRILQTRGRHTRLAQWGRYVQCLGWWPGPLPAQRWITFEWQDRNMLRIAGLDSTHCSTGSPSRPAEISS